jgi:hypothetical protein
MRTITAAHYQDSYRIWLSFDTGEEGIADLREDVFKYKAAEPLRSLDVFPLFHLDEWPTISWDCGFDLSPEHLFELVTGCPPAWACGQEPILVKGTPVLP